MLNGDSQSTTLVTGVDSLTGEKQLCDLSLRHISVLTQVTKPWKIHRKSLPKIVKFAEFVLVPFGTIDFNIFLTYNCDYSTYWC